MFLRPLLPLLLAALVAGCESRAPRIRAGGATFVDPLLQRWAAERYRTDGIEIDYLKKGSGYGIRQMTDRALDFGCTDTPLSRAETEEATRLGGEVLHIPLAIGAVAVIYNLPGFDGDLELSGPVLADIFLHKITRWNDLALASLNPGKHLPNEPIVPVYRVESSGTTYLFTEYLSGVSERFRTEIGSTKQPRWPQGGLGQEGSDGVVGHVSKHRFSIGYAEGMFARRSALRCAKLRNASGFVVPPDTANVLAAANRALSRTENREPYSLHATTHSLNNAPGDDSYPIVGVSYAVLYRRQSRDKGAVLIDFFRWATVEGQICAEVMDYVPLPDSLKAVASQAIDRITLE